MSESNWDTEEMGRWIANDQVLYNLVEDQRMTRLLITRFDYPVRETPPLTDTKTIVKDWLASGTPDGFTVDLNNVDWEAVL